MLDEETDPISLPFLSTKTNTTRVRGSCVVCRISLLTSIFFRMRYRHIHLNDSLVLTHPFAIVTRNTRIHHVYLMFRFVNESGMNLLARPSRIRSIVLYITFCPPQAWHCRMLLFFRHLHSKSPAFEPIRRI